MTNEQLAADLSAHLPDLAGRCSMPVALRDAVIAALRQSSDAYTSALDHAAMYVAEHCVDGERHAQAIRGMARPSATPKQSSAVATDGAAAPVATASKWQDGAPTNPWDKEWFIARTIHGDRVVLKALPEEYSFDFTTADHTYFKRDNIKRWMQFPDSYYAAPSSQPAPGLPDRALLDRIYCALQGIVSGTYTSGKGKLWSHSVEHITRLRDELFDALESQPAEPVAQTESDELPPLPAPGLERGTKLVPYEERYFRTSGMAAKLGYTSDLVGFFTADHMRTYGQLCRDSRPERELTDAEIIEKAKQAGLWEERGGVWMAIGGEQQVLDFARAVREEGGK